MSVSREDIDRIAELAELRVDDAAAARLAGQLTHILDYVAQLSELPADGNADAGVSVRLRRDEVAPDPLLRPLADFAPASKQGLVTVPRLGSLGDDPGAAE